MAQGHIRRRGTRSWAVKLDIGRDPATGERRIKWHSVKGTKRDAQRKLVELLGSLENGTYVGQSKLTVGDYLARWLKDAAGQRVSPKTLERYQSVAARHLIPALGATALTKLTPLAIQESYTKALASGRVRTGGALAAQTVKHHHRILSQALRQAVRWRLIARNPCDAVTPPRPAKREMHAPDGAQVATLLRAAEATRLYVPVLLAVTTGMRRGEILALRWRDVDLTGATLAVTRTTEQTNKMVAFKAPKTARSRRTITLPALAVDALRRHRVKQAEDRLRLGPIWQDGDLVCPADDGRTQSPREVTKSFRRLAAKAGVAVRFHDLRHGHATALLTAGVHPKVASERLGHASVGITLDTYSHVLKGMDEDAAERIDAALRTALGTPAAQT